MKSFPAFGSPMPNRSWSDPNAKYKCGFNGMEKDYEISAEGGVYMTEFRQFEARLGRWLSMDPISKPFESNFASFSNCPISKIDPDGNSDYYTAAGKYLGSDGTNGTDIFIVTDRDVLKLFKKKVNLQHSTSDPSYYK